jgi:hypothetical protein
MFQDDRSPLADVIIENFNNLAYDLNSVYKTTTYDEVNEILQANMDTFHKVCPEADLSVDVDLDADDEVVVVKTAEVKETTAATSTATKPTGKAPIALKLQDEDDAPVSKARATVAAKPAAVLDDDDFMATADAILKG